MRMHSNSYSNNCSLKVTHVKQLIQVGVKFVDYGNDLTFKWSQWFEHAKQPKDANDGNPKHDIASHPTCFVSAIDFQVAEKKNDVDLDELAKVGDDPMSVITIIPAEDYTGDYESDKVLGGEILVDGES